MDVGQHVSAIQEKYMSSSLFSIRQQIAPQLRPSEQISLGDLIPAARLSPSERQSVEAIANRLIEDIRSAETGGWVERFLQQYRLDTSEGKALLTLAEAFLRVPDSTTADALIRDKLLSADWKAHAGKSDSLLVNSATFGLMLAQSTVGAEPNAGILKKLIAKTGEPFVRTAVAAAMRMMGEQFVTGRTIAEALESADTKEFRPYGFSFDMLGESARTAEDAENYFASYQAAIAAVGKQANPNSDVFARHSISVKLSALHPRYEYGQAHRAIAALTEKLRTLATIAASHNIGLTVDAEETERLEMSLDIIAAVSSDPALKDWNGFGLAIQAYQKRAAAVVQWANALGETTKRRLTVRLVKGAYWDSEIKRTQERGLSDYPVFTRKASTDVSYLACAKTLLASVHVYPAFASHNALTIATILEWTGPRRDFEFQRLHGMGESLYKRLVETEGYACRVYAPVGGHKDLLAYLVRRLLENGANSSFVNQIADIDANLTDVLEDPVAEVERHRCLPHAAIPLPPLLFGNARRNSAGQDLTDDTTVDALRTKMETVWSQNHAASPIICGKSINGPAQAILDPANTARTVGTVRLASPEDVLQAVGAAEAAAKNWRLTDTDVRAVCLENWADLLERDHAILIALCVREAGKTIPDALAEVREAVDFCRYYANEARRLFIDTVLPGPTGESNRLRLHGRGVWACVSPWNFPLAIFVGQIAAALVAGNTVVAKPAPQTPLIAYRAVLLAHEAGIGVNALHLLPGDAAVGQALVADSRVAGVAFTGSTATAKRIARTLLDDEQRPLVPLIAETGGINCMIVDSTALPEQVVQDVIVSAFQSAGQRCSALRLLCLQEEVAEPILHMLGGAMQELRLGDPGILETDIGPVIDLAAHGKLMAYRTSKSAQICGTIEVPDGLAKGYYVPPTIIRLNAVADLEQEYFGPLLHVVTWKSGQLGELVRQINAKGFGLTLGVHSRLASVAAQIENDAKVGNIYVNRSMIGAVVGVQPFGGEGLSGTGPKAGGPHYLLRFVSEQTISTDTTAAGGNASLLAMADEG
jgi:RHH-type transcriptional regulator, proline utilization regulon repressor / proline dehydrogenase / delta 1-pyrroline-5-carboxylate dehydrogenase